MQNSIGIEYYQLLHVEITRSKDNANEIAMIGYNSLVKYSNDELENALLTYLHKI